MQPKPIVLKGVRQNNLKNINVEIPSRKLTVITGLSGSGKSSLAFETLYAEGQRRYIESLSTYTRQFLEKMPKPDIDLVANIPPAIALEQRNTVMNSRSTVGTQTELMDFFRILFAKVGTTFCLDCKSEVRKIDAETVLQHALLWLAGRKALLAAPLFQQSSTTRIKKQVPLLLDLLKEQGFRRVLYKKSQKKAELLDLDLLGTDDFVLPPEAALADDRLFIVIQRFKLATTSVPPDQKSQLSDSIQQALAVGRGRVMLMDLETQDSRFFECHFCCVNCGRQHRQPEPNLFSFNSPLGACPTCSGFGYTLELDENLIVPDFSKTLINGAIDPFAKPSLDEWHKALLRFVERHGISGGKRYRELTPKQRALIWDGDPADKIFPGIRKCFEKLARKKYKLHIRVFIRRYQSTSLCHDCNGARLNSEARAVKVGGLTISELLKQPIESTLRWFDSLTLSENQTKTVQEVLAQIRRRLLFLDKVGVSYLSLSRLARTLSGGEFQRINLATQLGSGLCGTLYVLDEPSIGLHAADTKRLIMVLEDLRNQGNTVVVVEHDLDVMKKADWLIELGPGAGRRGGEVICKGTAQTLSDHPGSLTGKYLAGDFTVSRKLQPRQPARKNLRITGCTENNLKNLDVEFPLERLVVVTGVSGSGKSTLVHRTLFPALQRIFAVRTGMAPRHFQSTGHFKYLYGAEHLKGVALMDQKPIGKSSRSNPATYLKAWDEVRRLYASQAMSLRRGYSPQYFSFNVDGGRCPVCRGEGEITVDMHFLADVRLPCEECDGKRFKKNILDVSCRGKNIHQLLNTTIDEAFDLFRDNPVLLRKFGILRDVGLGYLTLGQPAPTLSGGESQRLKIASVLEQREQDAMLFLFDEPTTGLHAEDVKKLLLVLQDLVSARNSVIVIEHHLDVIAQCDWVIDLGPGGGDAGGQIVGAGTPFEIVKSCDSLTANSLRQAGLTPPPRL